MALRDTLRFHRRLLATNLAASTANRGAFATQVVFMCLNDAIWFYVWVVFFGRYESIGGFRLADMALLQGVLATSFGVWVVLAAGGRELARLVTDGDLDTFLVQPKPVLSHVVASKTQANGFGDLLYGPALLVGFADLDAASWPWVPVGVLAGATALVAFNVLVHAIAFWAGPFQPFARQLNEILITVTGYPDRLFHGPMKVVLFVVLPAGIVAWLPVRLVREPTLGTLGAVLGTAAALVLGALAVFRLGLRRYESGSRFGSVQ